MSCETGLIVENSKNQKNGLIATSYGFYPFVRDLEIGSFETNDWVTFDISTNSEGKDVAKGLVRADAAIVKSCRDADNSIILKCKIEQIMDLPGRQKQITTDFIRTVIVNEHAHLYTKYSIGKNVNLKYIKNSKTWTIITQPLEKTGKMVLIGYVYAANSKQDLCRLYVPGRNEDFTIPKYLAIRKWYEVKVFKKTTSFDIESIKIVDEILPTNGSSIMIECIKNHYGFKTIFGDEVEDKKLMDNGRNPIQNHFWIDLIPAYANKPKFIVSENQNRGQLTHRQDLLLFPASSRDSHCQSNTYDYKKYANPKEFTSNLHSYKNSLNDHSKMSSSHRGTVQQSPIRKDSPIRSNNNFISSSNKSSSEMMQNQKDKEIAKLLRKQMTDPRFYELLQKEHPVFMQRLENIEKS